MLRMSNFACAGPSTPSIFMNRLLGRYRCPACGGPLSRTYFHPRAPIYELQFPPYPVPWVRICAVIAVVGLGLGFVHVGVSFIGVMTVAAWTWWKYYAALQCDECGGYCISGQFAGGRGQVLPWRPEDTRLLLRRIVLSVLVGLAVFTPIYLLESLLKSRCTADCASQGLGAEVSLRGLRCTCLRK